MSCENPKHKNKAKKQSSMEKKHKSMNDILSLDLIQRIFLRLPAKELFRLRSVSKLWHSLISDRDFAESHLNHSSVSPSQCLFVKDSPVGYFVDLDTVFNVAAFKEVSLPFKKKRPSDFSLLGSCRGFVLLNRYRHFLVVWNPLTGSCKRISYSHIVSRSKIHGFIFPDHAILCGFGYDATQDDYLVVLASKDKNSQQYLDCFSIRTNSWINLDGALPKPFCHIMWPTRGLFLHGAIHWLAYSLIDKIDGILVFDLKERSFSKISLPKQMVRNYSVYLIVLGGCLALFSNANHKTYIWVMKEYKVASSWILMYEIPHERTLMHEIPRDRTVPLCLSNGSDIIALDPAGLSSNVRFAKYNVSGELLQQINYPRRWYSPNLTYLTAYSVYTESLLPFPTDIKDKDKKKKTGHRVRQKCFEQLDVAKD